VAIVGFGAIGRETARRLSAFGVRVLAVRRPGPSGTTDMDAAEVRGPESLDEVLPRADVVVVCAPDTPETRGLMDAQRPDRVGPGAMLVNVARRPLVDEHALVAALESGQLRSAALDVTRVEPLPADSPRWDVPKLRISPHSASDHHAGYVASFDIFCANLKRYRAGEELANVVDQQLALGCWN
jgi:phosphoglycerate dehydrogenase-like enzyme